MPRIKLTAIVAGPDYRGQPGEIIEVPHKDAQQLVKAGAAIAQEPFAEEPTPVESQSVSTSATVEPAQPPPTVTSDSPAEAPAPAPVEASAKAGRGKKAK